MKAAVLQKLVRAREHREDQALRTVSERRASLAARINELRAAHAHLGVIRRERARLSARLQADGQAFDVGELARIEQRRALLREQEFQARKDIARIRSNVRQARDAVSESVRTYCKARARKDGAVTLRDRRLRWENQQTERQDEHAAEDHALSRHLASEGA